MVANRSEPPSAGGDAAKGAPAAEPHKAASVEKSSGMAAWMPLLVAVVAMPVLAYGMTVFVLMPKMQKAVGAAPAAEEKHSEKAESAHGEKGEKTEAKSEGKSAEKGGKKFSVPLKKVLVNVAGTQAMRFLMVSITLVGGDESFKTKVEESQDQLTDLASSVLNTKTITDLEKPGSRNLIRTELISTFNSALGKDAVRELYFTEFAVQ